MKKYQLEKPNLESVDKEKVLKLLFIGDNEQKMMDLDFCIKKSENPQYLYWDKIQYKLQIDFLKPNEFWFFLKLHRRYRFENSPIRNKINESFRWIKLDRYDNFFHQADLHTGGELFSFKENIDEKQKMRFVSRGILEEAIASSQLEGANTSRKVAREMIQSGRKAKNKSEHMILNNYRVMQDIDEEYKDRRLDLDLLLELHKKITLNTLDNLVEAGRLDSDDDRVAVFDEQGVLLHEPPAMATVKTELRRLLAFANDELDVSHFIHPITRAIMLHFWIGYLHPFGEGNGRLARVLFYWYLLRHGYWAFAYLPISKLIKKSPGQYKKAYIYTEHDDNDLTYFIDYNITIIQRAISEFQQYIDTQYVNNTKLRQDIVNQYRLNSRQLELLQYFAKSNNQRRTQIKIYQTIHKISTPTASSDLRRLEKKGFLTKEKEGRNVYYYPTKKVLGLYK